MMKRVSWFVSGAVAGVAGAGYAKRKVKETASQLAPSNIAKTAVAKVRERSHDVADAIRDGREAKREKESELRAKLGTQSPTGPSRAAQLGPDDVMVIEGRPVEAGQVIVLRDLGDLGDLRDLGDLGDLGDIADDRHSREDHVGPRRTSRRARRGS
jgi:hypothetical protein